MPALDNVHKMSQVASNKDHGPLLRKGSSSKKPLKEKIVQIYESFFKGEDPSDDNINFWDELFLLRVNSQYIESEFERLDGEQLIALKENINSLFYRCVKVLKSDHPIRIVNAVQTICSLIRGVFHKPLGNYGFDVINILIGFDAAEAQMQSLIEDLHKFLTGDYPPSLKTISFQLLLVLVTATDNVSQNTLLEYVMINSVFEAIIVLLASPMGRQNHGHDAVLLLTLLVQYRKYESANPYIVKLSILDDELALNGYAQVVSTALTEFNRHYQRKTEEPQGGFFSAITSIMSSILVAEEKGVAAVKANDSILLALYEAVHLNRNFITTLTHAHTPSTPATPPDSPTSPRAPNIEGVQNIDPTVVAEPASQPTNLLVTFLEYTSIVMQDTKDLTRYNNAKLCMIILTCISEDQYANSLMHDVNMNFRVPIHRLPMRHRKPTVDRRPPSRPLACALLDLMVEFSMGHLMKTFPLELYRKCLGITHRVLCYQKKCRVRLQYAWKELWTVMMNVLKFLMSNETHLLKKNNIFPIASQVVNIFNLFITYGDTFLPSPNSYDELYYEIIRMHQVFDNLYSMALRYTTTENECKESAAKLTNHLSNIRGIINHFSPKVDSWASANQLSSLTEEQVLEVVRTNYDTLTLKLQENLDQFERYSEKPKESSYFTNLVRSIISGAQKTLNVHCMDHVDVLKEFSTIS